MIQTNYAYWYNYAYCPNVTIINNRLTVAGMSVAVRQLYDYTESKINGSFNGCSGDTVFNLVNGQIWQQKRYAYRYRYAYRPEVLIYNDGSGYFLKVEGDGRNYFYKKDCLLINL